MNTCFLYFFENIFNTRHWQHNTPASLHIESAELPPTGQELLKLGGYNQQDADALPDFDDDDDVPMSSKVDVSRPETEQQYGPPELGIDDEDLYVQVSIEKVL